MNRLTTRNSMGVAVYKTPYECENCNETIYRLPDYGNGSPTDRLAEYEDAEEQKMLFKFPCKVGDTVYVIFSKNGIPRYEECEVEQIIIHAGIIEMNVLIKMEHIRSRLDIRMFGKTIFHTREEVWQKIKEM